MLFRYAVGLNFLLTQAVPEFKCIEYIDFIGAVIRLLEYECRP